MNNTCPKGLSDSLAAQLREFHARNDRLNSRDSTLLAECADALERQAVPTREFLMEVVCLTDRPDLQVQASAMLASSPPAPAQSEVAEPEMYSLDQIADACMAAEIPDSKFESISIALASSPPVQLGPVAGEIVAMRGDFDGYGYRYIDSGSGSDWRTRNPDWEPLVLAVLVKDERADFEAWAQAQGYEVKSRKPDGRYWSSHTHQAWEAWQARAALASQQSQQAAPRKSNDT